MLSNPKPVKHFLILACFMFVVSLGVSYIGESLLAGRERAKVMAQVPVVLKNNLSKAERIVASFHKLDYGKLGYEENKKLKEAIGFYAVKYRETIAKKSFCDALGVDISPYVSAFIEKYRFNEEIIRPLHASYFSQSDVFKVISDEVSKKLTAALLSKKVGGLQKEAYCKAHRIAPKTLTSKITKPIYDAESLREFTGDIASSQNEKIKVLLLPYGDLEPYFSVFYDQVNFFFLFTDATSSLMLLEQSTSAIGLIWVYLNETKQRLKYCNNYGVDIKNYVSKFEKFFAVELKNSFAIIHKQTNTEISLNATLEAHKTLLQTEPALKAIALNEISRNKILAEETCRLVNTLPEVVLKNYVLRMQEKDIGYGASFSEGYKKINFTVLK